MYSSAKFSTKQRLHDRDQGFSKQKMTFESIQKLTAIVISMCFKANVTVALLRVDLKII